MQGARSDTAPHQSPRSLAPRGRWPPSTPLPPQAVRRTGESVKSPYPPPRRGGLFTDPPGGGGCSEAPPPPSKAEGAPPVRAPRASRLARRLRLPSTSPALHPARRCGQLPRRANWRPTPPFPGPRSTAGRPSPGAGGGGTAGGAWLRGDRRAGGVVPRGSPCQGPHRKIPRHAGIPHATQRSHSCGPSLPQPRTVGPGSLLHRLTDPIWGVKIQNAVEVARNCSGAILYGGGPCTTKTPYKVGHFFEKLGDIWVLRACLRGRAPPKAPGKVAPLRPSSPGPPPPTMTMPYLLPRRGGLFTDPPPPGGRGLALQCLLSKTPPPHLPGKAAPSTPAPEPPGQAVERTGESPKVTTSSPNPRGGGALHRPYWQRGHALHYPPLKRPAPPDGPEGLPLAPPASTPGQAVERTGQSLKAPYLSPEPGASPTTPPAGGTWLSSAYHPKPRRQIDRDGATPAKEGATLLGKTKAPGPIAPPTTCLRKSPPCPLSQLA
ncbi:hypothetical protein N7530_012873 [Penicillium desertorum]|uniref:Uncharacterized protein n=1 Tax=Penicillium desertorum TaxID=1303715 RepID=A0A9W9WCX4_9EURO|nr:hypothetical protein N7530_012873 [Penicillium desertorum]